MRVPTSARRRSGVTSLEVAVVAPVTLLLLIGIVDTGLAVHFNNVVAEAAREGARYAVVHGSLSGLPAGPAPNDAVVGQVVRKYAFGMIPGNLQVQASWPDGDNRPGSRVTIRATYFYKPTGLLGAGTLQLGSASTMTICH